MNGVNVDCNPAKVIRRQTRLDYALVGNGSRRSLGGPSMEGNSGRGERGVMA